MSHVSYPTKFLTYIPKFVCEWLEWGCLSPRSSFRFSSAEGLSPPSLLLMQRERKLGQTKGSNLWKNKRARLGSVKQEKADKRSSLWEQELGCLECGNQASRNLLGTWGFMNDWSDSAPSMTRLSLPGAAFLILGALLFPSLKKKKSLGFAHDSCWRQKVTNLFFVHSLVHKFTWLS